MTVLVTGATGNIGRKVVDRLLELEVPDIRALTNNPAKANLPEGVEVVTGYLGKPETLSVALADVDRLYLAPYPPTIGITCEMIAAARVSCLVALSGGAHWQQHADTIAGAGVPTIQLGPGEFCENFAMWAPQIAATGTVREPYPDVVEAPIAMDDIARVAAALLAAPDDHLGQMYELTGPQALTRAQIAEQIGVGIGRPVRFETCSREEALATLAPVMGDQANWYVDLLAAGVQAPQQANGLVAELTGAPAISIDEWARRNADQFSLPDNGSGGQSSGL
ncbi:NmrA family NAD(P)-binding protein [Mycobacterium sp. AMU20-3851]|uniref:NmrA family NAD(P)-binding protein n=1 Tax=Mycobacterium sp. AMU20-3851 TaxID=3122055 RepID=UPI0037542CD3